MESSQLYKQRYLAAMFAAFKRYPNFFAFTDQLNSIDRFLSQLDVETGENSPIFSIIETNTFKHITHLSMRFVPGNDNTIKKYLANVVKEYKV